MNLGERLFELRKAKNLTQDDVAEKLNVSVIRKFAYNNNFELGQTIKVGYLDFYLEFYINEIIETPEAIQARANEYVWSDNTDFGYLYINDYILDKYK